MENNRREWKIREEKIAEGISRGGASIDLGTCCFFYMYISMYCVMLENTDLMESCEQEKKY